MWCREGEKHVLSRNLGEKWSSCSREDFAVLCHVPPPPSITSTSAGSQPAPAAERRPAPLQPYNMAPPVRLRFRTTWRRPLSHRGRGDKPRLFLPGSRAPLFQCWTARFRFLFRVRRRQVWRRVDEGCRCPSAPIRGPAGGGGGQGPRGAVVRGGRRCCRRSGRQRRGQSYAAERLGLPRPPRRGSRQGPASPGPLRAAGGGCRAGPGFPPGPAPEECQPRPRGGCPEGLRRLPAPRWGFSPLRRCGSRVLRVSLPSSRCAGPGEGPGLGLGCDRRSLLSDGMGKMAFASAGSFQPCQRSLRWWENTQLLKL